MKLLYAWQINLTISIWMYFFSKTIIFLFILFIKIYQIFLSPFFGRQCRFTPTCSSYAIDAITKYGCIKGSYLTFKRIIKCNPWGESGFDPVPD